MKIIKPSVEIIDELDQTTILKKLELCGRNCYKSEYKITENFETTEKFIRSIIKRGHESVLEHVNITVRFIVDRGISHEIVRHRIASYSQESTRYCNYSREDGDFCGEITVIEPNYLERGTQAYTQWQTACEWAEYKYFDMLTADCTAQEARAVLPHSLKTDLIMTTDVREWRHFMKLRTSPAAHPQMIEVAKMLLKQFKEKLPVLFEDIT